MCGAADQYVAPCRDGTGLRLGECGLRIEQLDSVGNRTREREIDAWRALEAQERREQGLPPRDYSNTDSPVRAVAGILILAGAFPALGALLLVSLHGDGAFFALLLFCALVTLAGLILVFLAPPLLLIALPVWHVLTWSAMETWSHGSLKLGWILSGTQVEVFLGAVAMVSAPLVLVRLAGL